MPVGLLIAFDPPRARRHNFESIARFANERATCSYLSNYFTMAQLVQLRTALQRVGLDQQTTVYATTTMQLNTLDSWRDFETDDDLIGFSKNLRSPGGGHPGFQVSVLTVGRIKIMRQALKHFQSIQRPVTPNDITNDFINNWSFLLDYYSTAKKKRPDEEDLPKVFMSDWAKTKEVILTHFNECYGEGGIPLAYVLRDDEAVPAAAADPQEDYNGDTDAELIRRAPHGGRYWNANNKTMCRLLKKIFIDTPAYTYIIRFRTDGRAAWMILMQTFLGPQHVPLQAAIYENKLADTHYDGESTRFTFDRYCEIHQLAHARLEALCEHGYHGMDEGTKIRAFLKGIRTEKLRTVVEIVRGNPDFPTFNDVSRRVKDAVVQLKPMKPTTKPSGRGIASVGKSDGGQDDDGVKPDMSIEDRFYSHAQYKKLTPAQKKGLRLKREQRQKSNDTPKQQQQPKKKNKQGKALSKEMKKLRKAVAALTTAPAASSEDESSDSDVDSDQDAKKRKRSSKSTSANRDNDAVSRKKRRS